MMKRAWIVFLLIILFGCEKQDMSEQKAVKRPLKTKEEIEREYQERDRLFKQLISERKEKYKDMLSVNRESGDIRGIWYMDAPDIKNIGEFFNTAIKPSMGYCIEVSADQKSARVYFAVIDKVFDVQIEKISQTKYAMIYRGKKRFFEVIKTENKVSANKYSLNVFFDDSHKYNPNHSGKQWGDGINFYDFCTSGINEHECSVEGCLEEIRMQDEID